jgi:hypothetical protein
MSNGLALDVKKLQRRVASFPEHRVAAKKAAQKREVSLHELLESVLQLIPKLRTIKPDKAVKLLSKISDNVPRTRNPGSFLIGLACPSLDPKIRSKYGKVLLYAERINWKHSIKKLLQQKCGLNGCVAELAKLPKLSRRKATGVGTRANKHAKRNEKTTVKGSAKQKAVAGGWGRKEAPAD